MQYLHVYNITVKQQREKEENKRKLRNNFSKQQRNTALYKDNLSVKRSFSEMGNCLKSDHRTMSLAWRMFRYL